MVRGRIRSNNLRTIIIDILSTRESPMTGRDISYKVESTTRYRASVSSVHQVMRPLIAKGIIRQSKPSGSPVHTYELI
jgi:DNA-binding PadR family transcriptional regulator